MILKNLYQSNPYKGVGYAKAKEAHSTFSSSIQLSFFSSPEMLLFVHA